MLFFGGGHVPPLLYFRGMKNDMRKELISRLRDQRLATAVEIEIAGVKVKVLKPSQDALSQAFVIARNLAEKEAKAASVAGQTLEGIKVDKAAVDLIMGQIEASGFKPDQVLAAAGLPVTPKSSHDLFIIQAFLRHMGRFYSLTALHDMDGVPMCKTAADYEEFNDVLTGADMMNINGAIQQASAKN